MADTDRLVELETRLAFQDQLLSDLNDVVTAQGREMQAMQLQLARVMADLTTLRGLLYADSAAEPPPPHY